ncbi:hypothetical protein [Streptococcus uberis]|uniref:hypothetical protein n=1 Tax=Streptococcus uberis TaxID=1349 RepID=UPI001FF6155D|nr:hypothetical protein [Streptococcus uberis]MCK1215635.1 hypothetical protein [Streptococcus uberis]
MIEVTFKGNSFAEIFEAMQEAGKSMTGKEVKTAEKSTKKVEPVKEEQVEVSEVKDFTLTMNDIKRLTKAKLEEGKSAQVKELLADFKVGKVSQLVEDQFIDFSERLEEL